MSAFEVTTEEPFSVVHLPERLDLSNTKGLLESVSKHREAGSGLFALDFSGTAVIDSTAIGALVNLYKSLRVGEGDLVLVGVQDTVQRVLRLTGLDGVLPSYESIDAARNVRKAS